MKISALTIGLNRSLELVYPFGIQSAFSCQKSRTTPFSKCSRLPRRAGTHRTSSERSTRSGIYLVVLWGISSSLSLSPVTEPLPRRCKSLSLTPPVAKSLTDTRVASALGSMIHAVIPISVPLQPCPVHDCPCATSLHSLTWL